jgi:hypothetical protein
MARNTGANHRGAVFAWIEGVYNRRRIHSTLGFVSPSDCEARYELRSETRPENRGTAMASSSRPGTRENLLRQCLQEGIPAVLIELDIQLGRHFI